MAGREKVGGDVTPVRFADGVLAQIDAVAGKGKRAEFIRDAVAAALKLSQKSVPASPAVRPVLPSSMRSVPLTEAQRVAANERADKMTALLEAIRLRAMTAREAAAELGWPELLVAKVADKLAAAGMIHFPRGAGVMVAI